jgi:hypothetical protein
MNTSTLDSESGMSKETDDALATVLTAETGHKVRTSLLSDPVATAMRVSGTSLMSDLRLGRKRNEKAIADARKSNVPYYRQFDKRR